tara:strand:+ start:3094 stop:3408 length:315 start_codon:yes stop_codon:yes gene_type:complete
MVYKKNISSISDELKMQYEENKRLREKIPVPPTVDTILKEIDQSLILLLQKVQEIKPESIEEKELDKINHTCRTILDTIEKEENDIVSSISSESFDTLKDMINT